MIPSAACLFMNFDLRRLHNVKYGHYFIASSNSILDKRARFTSNKIPKVFWSQIVPESDLDVVKKMETPAPAGNRTPLVQPLTSNYATLLQTKFIGCSVAIP
jgi:hypothetical protein